MGEGIEEEPRVEPLAHEPAVEVGEDDEHGVQFVGLDAVLQFVNSQHAGQRNRSHSASNFLRVAQADSKELSHI
jgi:hypothetical protein